MGRFRAAWDVLLNYDGAAAEKGNHQIDEWRKLADWLGLDPDTDEDERSEATYFACLKILSESIGKMPFKLMRRMGDGGIETARDHPLFYCVSERPNKYTSATVFWSSVEQNRNQFGNAYILVKSYGSKTSLWLMPSDQVQVWYDDAMRFDRVRDVWYLWSTPEGVAKFRSDEVIHLKTSNTFDGIVGVSVVDQLASTIKSNVRGQRMVDRLYKSDMSSKAVVQYTGQLSDPNTKTFLANLESYMSGSLSDDGIEHLIPIPPGATLTPLNMKLADSQFLDLRRYTSIQIASAFGIKPYQIGDYGKESYSSQEAQQLAFFKETLLYIVTQYEQEVTYKLLSADDIANGYFFKFNVSSILRADLLTQINALSTAVQSFIYKPNEARVLLDLPTVEGGDKLLGNGASIPIDLVGRQYVDDEPRG